MLCGEQINFNMLGEEDCFMITESFGPGGSYHEFKPIQYTVHNAKYKLVIRVLLNENPCFENTISFYDLFKEKKNVIALPTKRCIQQ